MSDFEELDISPDEASSHTPKQSPAKSKGKEVDPSYRRPFSDDRSSQKDAEKIQDGEGHTKEDAEASKNGEQLTEEGDPPTDDFKSKRQRQLSKIQNPGSNGKSKGHVVGGSGGSMIWWNADGDAGDGTVGTWEDAVYHKDIREDLLATASLDGQNSYQYPRSRGSDPFDETAFLASQEFWRGEDKQYWFTIADNILNRFEASGWEGPDAPIGWMYFGGKIVLDQDNHPVRKFENLPATLSSAAEAWLLEAISRIDRRICKLDLRARMPWTFADAKGGQRTIFTTAAIGNRTMRFREIHGLIPWTPKAGSDPFKNFVRSKMSPAQIANNTTEGLGTFTKAEIKEAKAENDGRFLRKAGGSRLSDETRRERKEKKAKSRKAEIKKETGKGQTSTSSNTPGSSTMSHPPQTLSDSDWYFAAMQAADAKHAQALSASPDTPWEDPPRDYRSVKPTNEQDKDYIQAALQVTHQELSQHFDESAPTTRELSYSEQWDELQMLYNNSTDPDIRAFRKMPKYLPRMARWHGGFAAWEDVSVMHRPKPDAMEGLEYGYA